MKKELKTLKDLEIAGHDVVREEAINWVKHKELKSAHDVKWMFQDFFNITEEDLK